MHAWAVACSTNFVFFLARRLQVLSHAGAGEIRVLLCVRKPLSTQQIMWSKNSCSRFPIRHHTPHAHARQCRCICMTTCKPFYFFFIPLPYIFGFNLSCYKYYKFASMESTYFSFYRRQENVSHDGGIRRWWKYVGLGETFSDVNELKKFVASVKKCWLIHSQVR